MQSKDNTPGQNTREKTELNLSNFPVPVKVKIPKGLAPLISHSSKDRGALDTWLILKAAYDSGKVPLTAQTKKHLQQICGRCFKTLHTRLLYLQSLQLVEYHNDSIYLASWEKLSEVFEFKRLPQHPIRFYFIRYNPALRVSDVLEQLFMKEKELQCRSAAIFKIHRDESIRDELKEVLGEISLTALEQCQIYHYRSEYAHINDNDKFIVNQIARADTSLSYRKWSKYFGYSSKGGFAYKKRKLEKLGLVEVIQRRWKVQGTHKSRESRKCMLGTAPYIPALKSVVFMMPDKFIYLSPSQASPEVFSKQVSIPMVENQKGR